MIILDTNVISEPLKPSPNPAVMRWLDGQDPRTLFVTSITLAELLTGLEIMPGGRRRTALKQALRVQIVELFEERTLPFSADAASAFATAYANSQAAGRRMSFADCAIAAIALMHGFTLATRNTSDFKGTDVKILDPWNA